MRKKGKFKLSAILLIVIILLIIGAIALFFIGLNKGWFGFGGINIQNFLGGKGVDDFTASTDCTFNIPKIRACEGEDVTSIIHDGKDGGCRVYFKFNNGIWQIYGDFATDPNGDLTITDSAGISGNYIFTALCIDSSFKICRTNNDEIEIVPCAGDSDGDGFSDEEEVEAGTDPNDPSDYPGSDLPEDFSQYTCGQNDDYCEGTCPDSHPYCYKIWTGLYTWACMCTNEQEEVHPAWKPGASNYYEHDETPPECYQDGDCPEHYFCFEGDCEPRCQDDAGHVRTTYLGADYNACWDVCDTDRDCCADAYLYYDGGWVNDEQWYYKYCEWYEGQRCSNQGACIPPGGNHP